LDLKLLPEFAAQLIEISNSPHQATPERADKKPGDEASTWSYTALA
jgi:hypothetical protein